MAVAKVVSNVKHNGIDYRSGETIEASLESLKQLEREGVVEKIIDTIEAEVVETRAAAPKAAVAKTATKKASDTKTNTSAK